MVGDYILQQKEKSMDLDKETEFLLSVSRIDSRTQTIERDLSEIKSTIKSDYIKKEEMQAMNSRVARIEKIGYGIFGTFIVAGLLALANLLLKPGSNIAG